MDLDRFLISSRKAVEESSRKVRDWSIFDLNYVPSRVFVRPEAQGLIEAVVRFDSTGLPFNLFICGSRGSGKTLLVKYLQGFLKSRLAVPVRYVNCRFLNTSSKILAELLGKRPRGLSASELFREFSERFERLVLVLDEVDLLSDREQNKDLLYLLSRSERKYMVVLLSNNPAYFSRIDLSARSSLQLEKVFFRNYDASEVSEILRMRCEEGGCVRGEEDVRRVAALTCKHCHGDVRVAIKSLQYLVLGRFGCVEDCFSAARRDLFLDLVSDQSDSVLLVLKAVACSEDRLVKPAYERYREVCARAREAPYSYMHFYNQLSYLQSVGLILLVTTRVHRGTSNSVEILFDGAVLEGVFRQRFGRAF